MAQNPWIGNLSRLLDSCDSSGALAPILFQRYTTITDENERAAFVIALIGEVLLARASNAESVSLAA